MGAMSFVIFAFICRYLTNSREAVDMMSRLFLDGVLALHIEFTGHLVAIVGKQVVIQRFIISRNTSSYACSMGSEKRGYLR